MIGDRPIAGTAAGRVRLGPGRRGSVASAHLSAVPRAARRGPRNRLLRRSDIHISTRTMTASFRLRPDRGQASATRWIRAISGLARVCWSSAWAAEGGRFAIGSTGMIVARRVMPRAPTTRCCFSGRRRGRRFTASRRSCGPRGRRKTNSMPCAAWPRPISRVSGRSAYVKVRLYYEVKDHLVWGWARRHHLVLASEFARREAIRFGVPADRVCVAPYPLDLDRFSPRRCRLDPFAACCASADWIPASGLICSSTRSPYWPGGAATSASRWSAETAT